MDDLEIRTSFNLELRTEPEERTIRGYAAVFSSPSVDLGWYTEEIAPGAFQRSLKARPDVVALVDHDTGKIVARVSAGNLEIREDERGLYHTSKPINTSYGDDLIKLVDGHLITSMSFGFRTVADRWETRDGHEHRIVTDAELFEVSYVVFPAYPASSVVRSVERMLREKERQGALDARSKVTRLIEKRLALIEKRFIKSK